MSTATKPKKKNAAAERVAEVMAETTAAIVAAIEQGIANPRDWRAPWHNITGDAMNPTNAATGNPYTGGNRIALALYSIDTGAPNHFATYNQWSAMSKHSTECNRTATDAGKRTEKRPDCSDACHIVNVRRGEKTAAYIIRPATGTRDNPKTGERESYIFGWAAHGVFHAGQIEGYQMPAAAELVEHDTDAAEDIAAAYRWARSTGATVKTDNAGRAYYSPTLDYVNVPPAESWTDAHGAWSTIAHELTHWTGHPDRLARTFGKKFGDMDYAAEELCAEMGAAFTLAAMGRSSEPRADHARYLAHWLTVLKSSPDALWHVAGRAEKAATYLAAAVERRTVTSAAA